MFVAPLRPVSRFAAIAAKASIHAKSHIRLPQRGAVAPGKCRTSDCRASD